MRRASVLLPLAALTTLSLPAAFPAAAQAYGERSALPRGDCDRACLEGYVNEYVTALRDRDPSRARFAANVRFTENSVELPVGSGLWGSVSAVNPADGMLAADTETGNAAWFGHAEEHGKLVFLALRIKVDAGRITEAETVVSRKTGMPLIFGTGKEPHSPLWKQALTPEQQRPRPRLRAVADSYFNTVEYNDGQVFAHFKPDCSRLENGISTTAATGNAASSASVAEGCEAQFKLGIYRINKQLRDRRYPLIDVERGVVVATNFFDHANTFDEYRLTDGRTMKTLLKWPNSLSIMEAFKIVDGHIQTIEATFDYVPYGMHSPWVGAQPAAATAATTAPAAAACDEACLLKLADDAVAAVAAKDYRRLPWADPVRYTENNVPLTIGDAWWGSTGSTVGRKALALADTASGNVVWFGTIWDHDAPAFGAIRLKAAGGRIQEMEIIAARTPWPTPFGDPKTFALAPAMAAPVAAAQRRSRERLVDIANAYLSTKQRNDGSAFASFAPACAMVENGVRIGGVETEAPPRSQACADVFRAGRFAPVERIRDRRFPVVDEARGLVLAISVQDLPARDARFLLADGGRITPRRDYPMSRLVAELVKVEGDTVVRAEGVVASLPFGMPTPWSSR